MQDVMILGAPVTALTPALVELLKQSGLPTRWAGAAAIGCALLLVALADLAGVTPTPIVDPLTRGANWLLAGLVFGLAGAGLYSQARVWRGPDDASPLPFTPDPAR